MRGFSVMDNAVIKSLKVKKIKTISGCFSIFSFLVYIISLLIYGLCRYGYAGMYVGGLYYLSYILIIFSILFGIFSLSKNSIVISMFIVAFILLSNKYDVRGFLFKSGFQWYVASHQDFKNNCIPYVYGESGSQVISWCMRVHDSVANNMSDVIYDPSGEINRKKIDRSDEWMEAFVFLAKKTKGSALNIMNFIENLHDVEYMTYPLGNGYYEVWYNLYY
ncbi:hypothetical protein BV494_22595 (plasmid) [Rahnella sikkimica]|uniref:Uncharacterized protein n=1 Tax=Rahnella sikkimica TaxID=1805933 RepID=A0A2L1UXN5_9GAMM|nr:hypothetical protein BV494_22595 [Rahnella sikkimica]